MNGIPKQKFYTQLEGLRGVAVFLVLVSHFIIIKSFPGLNFLSLGFIGVNLFFVLSGFLITEILLKEIIRKKNTTAILKSFYFKRTLRIFPIYYLSIAVLYILDNKDVDSVIPWAILYALNIKEIWFGGVPEIIKHLWSLCVEEQFYLIWPITIIFLQPFWRKKFIILMICLSVVIRFVVSILWSDTVVHNESSMLACMDALASGALIAYLKTFSPEKLHTVLSHKWVPLITITSFLGINYFFSSDSIAVQTFSRSLCAATGFFIVGWGALNIKTVISGIFENRVIRYLGKISYGVYLYHWILFVVLNEAFMGFWRSFIKGKSSILYYNAWAVSFLFFLFLTVIVASISFYLIEKPLLKFKDRYH